MPSLGFSKSLPFDFLKLLIVITAPFSSTLSPILYICAKVVSVAVAFSVDSEPSLVVAIPSTFFAVSQKHKLPSFSSFLPFLLFSIYCF